MTTDELAELFLTYLYDQAEAAPHPNFLFSLNEFIPMMGLTDLDQLQHALSNLGDRGLIILAGLDVFGGISAGITMEGSVYVEKGGETGIIDQYRRDPQRFVKPQETLSVQLQPIPESRPQRPPVGEEKPAEVIISRAVEAILSDMEDNLKRDNSVGAEIRQDLLADLETLRLQMKKQVKNKTVIEAILDNLSRVPSVAPLAAGLKNIVHPYLV
jgi:hypothetical protein